MTLYNIINSIPCGDTVTVVNYIDEQNRICRTDVKFPPTSAWRCIGVREVRAFGNKGPLMSLNEAIKHDTRFKNGRGKFVMVDFDHGTCREWGDRIVFIWEC